MQTEARASDVMLVARTDTTTTSSSSSDRQRGKDVDIMLVTPLQRRLSRPSSADRTATVPQ